MENRLYTTALKSLILLSLLSATAQGYEFKGYLKRDIFDGKVNLYQGEKVICDLNPNQNICCFDSYDGSHCISAKEISLEPVSKIDVYIEDVKYSDDAEAKIDPCNGTPISQPTDDYIWGVGFKLKSNKPSNDIVMVEASYIVESRGLPVYGLIINKKFIGAADGKCHTISFNKADISKFLDNYTKIKSHLTVEKDLNIPATLSIRIFSPRPEASYKNNSIRLKALLPSDSPDVWPPKTF